MGNFGKNIALWIIIGLLLVALFQLFQGGSTRSPSHELAFSEFIADVENGQVSDVTIKGQTLTGHYIDGREFNTFTPDDPTLVATLRAHQVQIKAAPVEGGVPFLSILLSWFPMLLLVGVWIFFMRQMQSGGGKAMGFGKSRATVWCNFFRL